MLRLTDRFSRTRCSEILKGSLCVFIVVVRTRSQAVVSFRDLTNIEGGKTTTKIGTVKRFGETKSDKVCVEIILFKHAKQQYF